MSRASLSGTVTDTSGAVVPQATVEALQTATQSKFTATTNESGVYNFIGLPLGDYTVTAQRASFSQAVRLNVVLTSNSAVRVDMSLSPGSVSEKIEVKAQSSLVEERSSAYGSDLEATSLESLPCRSTAAAQSLWISGCHSGREQCGFPE